MYHMSVTSAEVPQQTGAEYGVRGGLACGRAELRDARVLNSHVVEELKEYSWLIHTR